MEQLTKDEISVLYSIAAREAQLTKKDVTQDDEAYKRFIDYWDKLADKLRVLHEQA
jgi:hypothetical protein